MDSLPAYKTQDATSPTEDASVDENIDYPSLQKSLGLERAPGVLGYTEKSFATCTAGYGYASSRNCRRDFFAVIHFQLLCRDSEGTISTALNRDDMRALSRRSASWTLSGKKGTMQMDEEGQGQILMSFSSSPRFQRLKLTVDNDFLYLKAGEINRVVVPGNWCN